MRRSRKVMVAVVAALTVVMATGCSSNSDPVAEPAAEAVATPVPATPTVTPETTTPDPEPPVVEGTPVPTAEATTEIAEPTPGPVIPEPEPEAEDVPEAQEPSVTTDPDRPLFPGLLQDPFCVVDIVAPDTLNVRIGPSTDEAIVGTLEEGECGIYVYGNDVNGWIEIVADRGDSQVRGWVSTTYIALELAPIDPDAPTVVITIDIEYSLDAASSEQPLDAFRLTSDGLVVGVLDANGQVTLPADLDISRTLLSAEFANDAYCAWTGRPVFDGANNRYTAQLMALCA